MRFIFLITLLILFSCGSRKSEVQTTIENKSLDVKESSQYDVQAETRRNILYNSLEEGFTITPIDSSKPIDMIGPDGRKTSIKNGRVESKRKQQSTAVKEEIKESKSGKSKIELQSKENKKEKQKNTERKPDYSWLWLLLIVAVIYVIYRIKKRA